MYEHENSEFVQYSYLPVKNEEIFAYRNKILHSHWIAQEAVIKTAKDTADWKNLTEGERHLLKFILSFFAVGDGIVNEKIEGVILKRVEHRDWISFENQKAAQEDIHNETYSLLIQTYIEDAEEREKLLDSVKNFKSISDKKEWFDKYFDDSDLAYLSEKDKEILRKKNDPTINALLDYKTPLAQVLLLMIIMEGIFFSSSFCIIYWFKERGLLPALSNANAWIARDEGTHTQFNIYIYNTLTEKLGTEFVHKLLREAVELEYSFIKDAIPENLLGMNARLVHQYIKYVADSISQSIGYGTIYNVTNPFNFMDKITIDRNTDFFISKPVDYSVRIELSNLDNIEIEDI